MDPSVLPSQFFRLFLIFSHSAPALHAKQPVQLREVTRVKDFPAGNAATSASRIAFLHSLCKLLHFVLLLDLVPSVVRNFLLTMVSQLNYRKYSQSLHQCQETTLPWYHGTVERFTYHQNSTLGLHSRVLYRFERFSLRPISLRRGKGQHSFTSLRPYVSRNLSCNGNGARCSHRGSQKPDKLAFRYQGIEGN